MREDGQGRGVICAKRFVHDLIRDPERKMKLSPILVGEDSTNKKLLSPFLSPGVQPYKPFDLEVSYVWPAIVNIRKDYWFIDPINYSPEVKTTRFNIRSADRIITAAFAFKLNSTKNIAEFQGSIPIEIVENSQQVSHEINTAEPDVFYIILVEGKIQTVVDSSTI